MYILNKSFVANSFDVFRESIRFMDEVRRISKEQIVMMFVAIAVLLSKMLDVDSVRALKLFYESKTCANLHDKSTGLYLYGDLYVANEFILEMQNRQ